VTDNGTGAIIMDEICTMKFEHVTLFFIRYIFANPKSSNSTSQIPFGHRSR